MTLALFLALRWWKAWSLMLFIILAVHFGWIG